jgi:N-acyl-D-amino-acid deacylase
MYDIKIMNARYPDFETGEFKTDDICIKDGRIEYIGKTTIGARVEIDGSGLITSPGFVDIHMHEEELDKYSELDRFYVAERMLKMGVTTALAGNCGINYQSPEEFIDAVKRCGSPINYMIKIGYNTLRKNAGLESPFDTMTSEVLEDIKGEIKKALPLGVKGISFGIEYSPGISYEEMLEVSKLLDPEKHIISAHYRKDGSGSMSSIDEMITLSKDSNIPMQISHIGSCSGYGFMDESLERIEKSRKNGIDVLADCYPYNAFCTYIGSTVFDEGCLDEWKVGYDSIMMTEEPYRNIYCTKEIFDDSRVSHPNMLAVAFVMNEQEIVNAMKSQYVMIGSDEIYNGSKGHPRGAGSFPRVLGKYVREEKIMKLIEALYKMTRMPADRLGLSRKGQIKEGVDADITIFNEDTIIDRADFSNPTKAPEGIEYVIVNGKLALKKSEIVNDKSGIFISA